MYVSRISSNPQNRQETGKGTKTELEHPQIHPPTSFLRSIERSFLRSGNSVLLAFYLHRTAVTNRVVVAVLLLDEFKHSSSLSSSFNQSITMARSDDDESYHDGNETSDDESSDNDNHPDGDTAKASGSMSAAGGVTGESTKETEFRPLSRTKLRKKKSYDAVAPEDLLPTFARKTERGGYAHTNQTKSRISQANTGNTPWNKGRNRSSEDRAKIAAGVRARNRAILLEKLKRLGLSEEEWYAKKKEIKYLRERVRRAKVSARRQEQAEAERSLQAVIDATTEKVRVKDAFFHDDSSKLI